MGLGSQVKSIQEVEMECRVMDWDVVQWNKIKV